MLTYAIRSLFEALCVIMVLTCVVFAEPPQINIVAGDGNISQTQSPSTSTTDFRISGHVIGETTQANILPGETWNMRFDDPTDTFLLRVLDPTGTRILGNLNIFNGNFTLLNIHGLDIGSSARVNVNNAAFVASTLDIQNKDFISGKYAFDASVGANSRAVSNHGLIRTTGSSSVVLLGQAVENAGVIEAPLSKVALASGDAVTLSLDANGLISVDVKAPVRNKVLDMDGQEKKAQVSNTGTINADGGEVLVSAMALNDVFDRSVNLEGCIRANKAVQGADGTIRIVASDDVVNTGTLETRDGELSLTSGDRIKTLGYLFAKILLEQGFSFQMGGVVEVGRARLANVDGAVVLATGLYSGTFEDAGDIIVDNNAQITLTGSTEFWADSDPGTQAHDGNGIFTMNSGSAIIGGNRPLTIYSADRDSGGVTAPSVIRDISGVTELNLFRSPAAGASPKFTLLGAVIMGGHSVDIDGDLVLAAGGALSGATEIFITGNWTNNGGMFTPGTSRVTFLSTLADQLINGTALAQTFYDIRVAKGSKTLSVGGSTTTLSMHDLDLESGVLAAGTATTFNIAGDVVFGSLALSGFNGLTLDADTFTVSDVADMIGDTMRTYYPVTDAVLDAMIAEGKVKTLIIGVPYDENGYGWLAQYWGGSVPVGTNRVNMVDHNYVAYLAHVKDRISAAGSNMGLIVEFGNEYNFHPEWFGGNINNWFSALTAATSAVHTAFGTGVRVSTASGDNPADFVATIQTGVDLVGVNTYRGLGNASSLVSDWNAACAFAGIDMPFYVSEAGFPSWVADGGELQQNIDVLLLRDELLKNDLGVTFMSFEDNMRKGGSPFAQDAREDYWGWLREDGTHKSVYDTMAAVWTPPEFQAGSAHINVAGDWVNNGGLFTPGTSTVTFGAANAGHVIRSGASAFWNVVFDDGGLSGAWATLDPMNVNGNLTLNSGDLTLGKKLIIQGDLNIVGAALNAVGNAIDLSGSWYNTGTFTHGNNTVTLNGNAQTVFEDGPFYNLSHTGAGTTQAAHDLNVVNAFTNTNGIFDANDHNITIGGLTTVSGGEYRSRSGVQALNGGLAVSGGVFTGSTGAGRVDINGDLFLSAGGALIGGTDIYINGDWINNGGAFTPGVGTVTFDAVDPGHVIRSGASAFANIIFNDGGANGAWAIATDPMNVNGNMTLAGGSLTLGKKLTIQGNLNILDAALNAAGNAIDLSGDWHNTGTFIHGNNTVTLTGQDQAVSGNNTFYNLSKTSDNGAALTFEAGSMQTIDGKLTLRGHLGEYMRLGSDVPGDQWKMRAGSVDMSWLDLKDAHNTGLDVTLLDSLDSGNNTGYVFGENLPIPSIDIPWWNVLDIRGLTADLVVPFDVHLFAQFLGSSLIQYEMISVGDDPEAPAVEVLPMPQDVMQGGGLPVQSVPPLMFSLPKKFAVE